MIPLKPRTVGSLLRFARLLSAALVAGVILGIGESIDALHALDDVFAPYTPVLRIALPSLVALGFAMFMGGILWLLLSGAKDEGTMHLREIGAAWRNGTWRSTRMMRFFVIAGGVLLMILAGFAAGIVFGEPGLRLLLLLIPAYALVRYLLARRRMAASM